MEADSDNLTLRNILTELVRKRVSHEMTDAMTVAKFKLGPNAEAHIRRVSTEETSEACRKSRTTQPIRTMTSARKKRSAGY